MAKTADELRREVLSLPGPERARIAADLLASLDDAEADEADVDAAWSRETARRASALTAGETELVSWEHVLASIEELRAQPQA